MEVLNYAKELQQTEDKTGERSQENLAAIQYRIVHLMYVMADELNGNLKAGNPAIFNEKTVQANLLDLEYLLDEITLHFYNQKKEIENENRKQIEQLEREKGNFIL